MTSMRARVAFPFHGRELRPGDLLQAPPAEAAALRYQGKADFVNAREMSDRDRHTVTQALSDPPADAEPDADPPAKPPKRTRKRRKDIQAKDLDQG